MPGLIRGVARTAVVAGTATAVSNRVSRRQAARWSEPQQPQQQAYQEPAYQEPAYQEPVPQAPPPMTSTDRVAALKDLADLQTAGILSPAEFEREKARILAS
jgi:hypothetical protein